VHVGEKQAGQEQSEEFGLRDVELVGRDEGRVGGRERASSAFQSGSRSLPPASAPRARVPAPRQWSVRGLALAKMGAKWPRPPQAGPSSGADPCSGADPELSPPPPHPKTELRTCDVWKWKRRRRKKTKNTEVRHQVISINSDSDA